MLDQLSGEICKLERMAATDTRVEDINGRVDDQPHKEPDGAVRVREVDVVEGPRVTAERQESRRVSNGRESLRDSPPEQGQNQGNGAESPPRDDSGSRHASVPACSQAGRRGEPLDDHTNMGPELPPGATGERLSPPEEQMALQQPLPKSPISKVENGGPATAVESAQLRSELREARALAEKFRGELSAAQKM